MADPDPVKRVNYHDILPKPGEHLKFDQNYQLAMRRSLNRYLHTWGIVHGLEVTRVGDKLKVSPGMAIDSEGREIVLVKEVDPFAPDPGLAIKSPDPNQTYYITIEYDEKLIPADEMQIRGKDSNNAAVQFSHNSRTSEIPKVTYVEKVNKPADDGKVLILAAVKMGEPGEAWKSESDRSQETGQFGIDLTLKSLTFKKKEVTPATDDSWPKLSCSAVNQATLARANLLLARSSTQELLLGADGNVAFLSSTKPGNLELRTGDDAKGNNKARLTITEDGKIRIGTIIPDSNLNELLTISAVTQWSNSSAFINFRNTSNNFLIGVRDNAILSTQNEQDLVLRTNQKTRLTITKDGKVGIGTAGPDCELTISAPKPAKQTDPPNPAYANIKNDAHELRLGVDDKRAVLSTEADSGLALRTNKQDRLVITKDGEVYIESTTPNERLTLGKGNIHLTYSYQGSDGPVGNLYFGHPTQGMKLGAGGGSGYIDLCAAGSGELKFRVDNKDGTSDRMLIRADGTVSMLSDVDIGGKLGIGTAGPDCKLTISEPGKVSTSSSDAKDAYANIKNDAHELRLGVDAKRAVLSTEANSGLALRTGNQDRLIIDKDGKVGIGTTSPTQLLDVSASTSGYAIAAITNPSYSVTAGSGGSQLAFQTKSTEGNLQTLANLKAVRQGAYTSGDASTYNADLVFETEYKASPTERMRIKADGTVSVTGRVKDNKIRADCFKDNDVSTTSAAWALVPDMSVQVTPVINTYFQILAVVHGVQGGSLTQAFFRILMKTQGGDPNGTELDNAREEFAMAGGNWKRTVTLSRLISLAVGTHTITVEWRSDFRNQVDAKWRQIQVIEL